MLDRIDRREFLQTSFRLGFIASAGGILTACEVPSADYGPLMAADSNGLMLPGGFASRKIATSGSKVGSTNYTWPANPDGGACFDTGDGGWIYVSNAETSSGGGGASMVRFDGSGAIIDAKSILSGTTRNCAGGVTPWSTWLSCEETATGQVWECDPFGVNPAVARPAMGRFNHEAAAVDPETGYVYMTEDASDGGFYRFIPNTPGNLASGTLQIMTEVSGNIGWANVPDPDGSPTPTRSQVATKKAFNGGEGLWHRSAAFAFTTKGDNRVWLYAPSIEFLVIVYDLATSSTPVLSGVDNLVMATGPMADHIFVAEDGGNMEICTISAPDHPANKAYVFCRLIGRSSSEITGPAFSPDNTRLYFSSQRTPGETFEVIGPFR